MEGTSYSTNGATEYYDRLLQAIIQATPTTTNDRITRNPAFVWGQPHFYTFRYTILSAPLQHPILFAQMTSPTSTAAAHKHPSLFLGCFSSFQRLIGCGRLDGRRFFFFLEEPFGAPPMVIDGSRQVISCPPVHDLVRANFPARRSERRRRRQ